MAINSVNGVTFGNDQKKSSGSGGFVTVTTLGGAAIGAFGVKEEIGAKKILGLEGADKFVLRGKEELTEEQKTAKKTVEDTITANKKETFEKTVNDRVADLFKTNETITPKDYLGGKEPPADLGETIKVESPKTEGLKTKATEADAAVTTKETTYNTAKTAKEVADKGTDEAAKTKAKTDFEAAEKELKEAKGTQKTANEVLEAHQQKLDQYKFLQENVKDGKLTKDVVKTKFAAEEAAKLEKTAVSALEKLKGRLPKVTSVKKGFIGAAIGLVGGLILAKMFAPKKHEAPTT